MSYTAILGSGFGIYGYLPALIDSGRRVILPKRYRERFSQRTELTSFAEDIEWAADERSALEAASSAVLALCPEMQSRWLNHCLELPQLQTLFLEKPLAAYPSSAKRWHQRLNDSGKRIRIAYLFRFLDWAAELRRAILSNTCQLVAIEWRFHAHHFRQDVKTWKRDHQQGGGALRFYGIHIVALLAELGYQTVSEVSHDNEYRTWQAIFSGPQLPVAVVEIDTASLENQFSLACDFSNGASLRIERIEPFQDGKRSQVTAKGSEKLDYRVELLREFSNSAWNSDDRLPCFYGDVIQLWESAEQASLIQQTHDGSPTNTRLDSSKSDLLNPLNMRSTLR